MLGYTYNNMMYKHNSYDILHINTVIFCMLTSCYISSIRGATGSSASSTRERETMASDLGYHNMENLRKQMYIEFLSPCLLHKDNMIYIFF